MSMSAVFERVFGCCLSRKSSRVLNAPLDETTHLIPASNEPVALSLPSVYDLDHQKVKERMSTIVRSKEGKMVNVSARLPFNLHNRNLSATMLDPPARYPSSGASNSASASATTPHRPSFPLQFTPISPSSTAYVHGQVGAPLSSVVFPTKSRESSLGSHEQERERERAGSETSSTQRSMFGLTLVRSPSKAARGRKKWKAAAEGASVEGGAAVDALAAAASGDSNGRGGGEGEGPNSLGMTIEDGPPTPRVPKPSSSPPSSVSFTIYESTPLTVSWGD